MTQWKVVRRALVSLAGVGMILGISLFGASPAQSVGPNWTHNNYYSYSLLKNTPSYTSGGAINNLYNDTRVYMLCWTDTAWVTNRSYSNYNSPRWFRVQTSWGQVGYIHSSYVYYQQSVGRC